jgi:hypothetical protein
VFRAHDMMGGARGGETGEGPRDETQDRFCSGQGQEMRGERRKARGEATDKRREERQQTRDKREKGKAHRSVVAV